MDGRREAHVHLPLVEQALCNEPIRRYVIRPVSAVIVRYVGKVAGEVGLTEVFMVLS